MDSREPSAAPSSGGDTIDDQPEDVKPVIADLDRDDSAAEQPPLIGTPSSVRTTKKGRGAGIKKPRLKKGSHVWPTEGGAEGTEDEGGQASTPKPKKSGSPEPDGRTQGTAVGTRRQANGTVGSVYSGSKVRHIKKPDGTPLWRKEIQYEFLHLVIEDTTPCFTRISDGKKDCNFADIYIDCMARSSKTSKILKERLHVDRQAAQNMAMICLLVNVGRMNTTLNFFPEMRAQLRTYHSIPSLQAYKSQKDYKSLQDAPRLKSILKGASEDTDEPRTIPAIKAAKVPRTNPVNLIFVLSQFAPDVAQMHFIDKVDFFDLAIRPTISSKSRATAFLWLMWWYLESTHDRDAALNNPFGPGEFAEDQDENNPNDIPQLVPRLENITEEEGDAENVDPEEEKVFAEKMTRERKRIMTEDRVAPSASNDDSLIEHKGVKRLKKSARDNDDESDADSLRASPGYRKSPAGEGVMGMLSGQTGSSMHGAQADSIEDDWEAVDPHPGRGRYKRIKGKNTPSRSKNRVSEGVGRGRGGRISVLSYDRGTPDTLNARGTPQPLPPGAGNHPILTQFSAHRPRQEGDSTATVPKSRARTGYQRQLEEHRNSRIEWLLRKKRRDKLQEAKARRQQDSWIRRIATRVQDFDATYDSEEEEDPSGFPFASAMQSFGGPGQQGQAGIGVGGLIVRRMVAAHPQQEDDIEEKGLLRNGQVNEFETDDFGEEAETWLKVFKRTKRRLDTWSGEKDYRIYLAKKEGGPLNGTGDMRQTDKAVFVQPTSTVRRTAGRPAGRRSGAGSRRDGPGGRGAGRRSELSLNDEITQELLAERSDEDIEDADVAMEDGMDVDGEGDIEGAGEGEDDGEGEVEGVNSDVDMD